MHWVELLETAWFNQPDPGPECEHYFDPETGEVVVVWAWTPEFEEGPEFLD